MIVGFTTGSMVETLVVPVGPPTLAMSTMTSVVVAIDAQILAPPSMLAATETPLSIAAHMRKRAIDRTANFVD
ncbi:uncharacterized protein A4U43_C08F27810 [Asparagus officinalis]|nr:uncharacterized protein A4U43_C08F27810 [Asparagus officinalis]